VTAKILANRDAIACVLDVLFLRQLVWKNSVRFVFAPAGDWNKKPYHCNMGTFNLSLSKSADTPLWFMSFSAARTKASHTFDVITSDFLTLQQALLKPRSFTGTQRVLRRHW
jgi:hypothetical protein